MSGIEVADAACARALREALQATGLVSEFVAVTSANTAKLFNIYPQKGSVSAGADADLVVWDPAGTKTLSVKTQQSKVDYNTFEGMQVRGVPSHTVSQGKLVYAKGDLRVEKGVGRYIKRAPFGSNFDAAVAIISC